MSVISTVLSRNSVVCPDPLQQLFFGVRRLGVKVSLPDVSYLNLSTADPDSSILRVPSPKFKKLTAASHLIISDFVHVAGSPLGSSSVGNMSPPHMAQTATPVTRPVKAIQNKSARSERRTDHERSWKVLPRKAPCSKLLATIMRISLTNQDGQLTFDFSAWSSGVGMVGIVFVVGLGGKLRSVGNGYEKPVNFKSIGNLGLIKQSSTLAKHEIAKSQMAYLSSRRLESRV